MSVEPVRALSALLSTANRNRSIDNVTVKSGNGKISANTVMATITAAGADKGKLTPHVAGGSNGAQTATHVLGYPIDTTDADVETVALARDCEVKDPELVFDGSVDDDTKRATALGHLADKGIIAR